MIIDDRYITFLNTFSEEPQGLLAEIEAFAKANDVPIIRRETQSLIAVLLEMKKPERVLEVGTAVGFSALLMAEHLSADAKITTIESYAPRIPQARANFARAGRVEQIELLEGDAAEILPELTGPYDFVFMDAAKGQYLHFLDDVLRLLSPGGILVSDNVLQDGDIIQSRFLVERRNRTIHKRMREYLHRISHLDSLQTAILPVGDGVTISVKKGMGSPF